MAYIGKEPADSFISFAKQDFSTSATTSYTLDNAVTNENELALFINFVRQEPTTAYTASGTTLTLTSATTSSDDMYCVYLGQAKQTVNAPDGSVGSSQVAASIITGQTALGATPADTDELLISDAGTLKRVDYSYLKSSMTPAFEAYLSASQNVSNNTHTKVEIDTEVLDTDGCFDNSTNYRFTPTTAGKYFVFCGLEMTSNISSRLTYCQINLYKNGSSYQNGVIDPNDSYPENRILITQSAIVDMNGSSDYLELYGRVEASSATPKFANGTKTHFGAYKIIE
jgi:hypothetical protein